MDAALRLDCVGRDRGSGGDPDGIDFVCRDLECSIVGLYEEAVLALLEV